MVFHQPSQLHSNGRKVAVEVTTETVIGLGKRDVNINIIFSQVGWWLWEYERGSCSLLCKEFSFS